MKYVYELFDDTYGESVGIFGTYGAAAKEIAKRTIEEVSSREAELEIAGTRNSVDIKYEVKQHEVKE